MKTKLILGTVQFGQNYGINNSIGKLPQSDVFQILDEAALQGINLLDTADAYGNAVEIIGKFHQTHNHKFDVLSKFKNVDPKDLKETAEKSLEKLNISSFKVYSYHSSLDYFKQPNLQDELHKLKQDGLTEKVGISIYTNDDFEKIITSDLIDVIQLPYNLLDNTYQKGNLIHKAKQFNKTIHVRSVFLQGLIFKDLNTLPEKLQPLSPYLQTIRDISVDNNITIESLALSYAIFNNEIDNVLIGVDTKQQLLDNIKAIHKRQNIFNLINNSIKVNETKLLNPVNW